MGCEEVDVGGHVLGSVQHSAIIPSVEMSS